MTPTERALFIASRKVETVYRWLLDTPDVAQSLEDARQELRLRLLGVDVAALKDWPIETCTVRAERCPGFLSNRYNPDFCARPECGWARDQHLERAIGPTSGITPITPAHAEAIRAAFPERDVVVVCGSGRRPRAKRRRSKEKTHG